MREEDFTRLSEKYIRRFIRMTVGMIKESHRNRGFIELYYLAQLARLSNMKRDEYAGQLINLYTEVRKRGLAFTVFLHEAEHYRTMMLPVIEENSRMKDEIIFDEAIYLPQDNQKCKIVIRYLLTSYTVELLHDMIETWFPLSAVLNSDVKSSGLYEFMSGGSLSSLKKQRKLSNGKKAKVRDEPAKPRRLEYPEEMNSEEAAEYLSTTVDNLYQMTSTRQIPYYKRGRKLMFKKSELKGWRLNKVMSEEEYRESAIDRRIVKHRYRAE